MARPTKKPRRETKNQINYMTNEESFQIKLLTQSSQRSSAYYASDISTDT